MYLKEKPAAELWIKPMQKNLKLFDIRKVYSVSKSNGVS